MTINITDPSQYPHNLSIITSQDGIAGIMWGINQASNNWGMYGLLILFFIVIFGTMLNREYDIPSCFAFTSGVLFVPAFIGRLIVYDSIPIVPTEIVIFLGLILASSLALLYYNNRQ